MDQLGISILMQWRAEAGAARLGGRRPAPEPGSLSITRVAPTRLTGLRRGFVNRRNGRTAVGSDG